LGPGHGILMRSRPASSILRGLTPVLRLRFRTQYWMPTSRLDCACRYRSHQHFWSTTS
jgi:hypothetical protein